MRIKIKLYKSVALFIKKHISIKKKCVIFTLKKIIDFIADTSNFLLVIKYKIEKLFEPISNSFPCLNPYSPVYLIWETIVFAITISWFIFIPYCIAFSPENLIFNFETTEGIIRVI